MTDFLKSLLTEAYPELKGPTARCEYCEEVHEDLVEVDDSDISVGYYSKIWMCANCRYKRRIEKARGY